MKIRLSVYCMLLSFLFSCSSQQAVWYKKGAGQADFNIDDAECQIIAEQFAKEATLTKQRIDVEEYAKVYERCIYNRGWSPEPIVSDAARKTNSQPAPTASPIAAWEDQQIKVFGRVFKIPKDFSLTDNRFHSWQSVKTQTLSFHTRDGMSLIVIFQAHTHRKFDSADFPANEPFFIYDKGGAPSEGRHIRWTVFAGDHQGNWLSGIGAYYLLDKDRRVTMILTTPISLPEGVPPEGLRLTRNQKDEIDEFQASWIKYIQTAFDACPDCTKKKRSWFKAFDFTS